MTRRLRSWGKTARTVLALVADAAGAWVVVLAIASTSAAVAAWISTIFAHHLKNISVPLSTFSIGLLVGILARTLPIWQGPSRWVIRGYRYVQAEYIYEIDARDVQRHSQTIRLMIEAIRPGVAIFELRYRWTGTGTEHTPEVLSANHHLLGTVLRTKDWRHYFVHLGRELEIGEREEVITRQEFRDERNDFLPFLGKVIKDPINSLTLRVLVPRQLRPTGVVFRELRSDIEGADILREEGGTWDQHTHEMKWQIPAPRFGRYYEISWTQNSVAN
jgi:hypothetical protein